MDVICFYRAKKESPRRVSESSPGKAEKKREKRNHSSESESDGGKHAEKSKSSKGSDKKSKGESMFCRCPMFLRKK